VRIFAQTLVNIDSYAKTLVVHILKAASKLRKKFKVHSGFLSKMVFTTLWLLFKIAYRKLLTVDISDSFLSSFLARQRTTDIEQTERQDISSSPPPRPPRARDIQLIDFNRTTSNIELANIDRGADVHSDSSNGRVFFSMGPNLSARFSHSTPTSLSFNSVLEPSNV
jgi:hypothetical protein